ncbi:hypothetical protein [Thermogymnomonas acidicola]|uniref:hypothetical protein n=1 Tax=Thermogymnomonas acidicola TaxID=399579 RepID=UPI00094664D7|nr:hypothetical protein [Thermogymnomonas acidicola]
MIVEEGSVKIYVPEEQPEKGGPGRAVSGFYNRSQKLNRDVTLSLLSAVRPRVVLDGFSGGTGVRAIRIGRELGLRVVAADTDRVACRLSEENARANGVDLEVLNESFNCVVERFSFDYIDIDPLRLLRAIC